MGQTSESLDLNGRGAFLSAGLPSPSSLTRCHLSQSERPWQSAKFPFWNLYALLPQGEPSGAALRLHAFAKGSHFGGAGAKRLRGRGCWQEAAHLVWLCLAEAQLHRKHDLNLGPAPPLPGLPSPSSLRDATSPKVRGLGSPRGFRFNTLRPATARGAVRRNAQTSRLCQGLSLWESWREAPERARTLPGRLRPGLA